MWNGGFWTSARDLGRGPRGGKIAVPRYRSSPRDRQNPRRAGSDGTGRPGEDCLADDQRRQEADMSDHWRISDDRVDIMRATGEDAAAYAAGWTLSGLVTLATIVVVWVFAI
jgi:hypothetical protein